MQDMEETKNFHCKVCNSIISGSDCAYMLSYYKNWKYKKGCYSHCDCGFPIHAKELRNFVFTDFIDNDMEANNENSYIYCENDLGRGHVYYGTFNKCEIGNGFSASDMKNKPIVYERYRSFK